MSLLETKKLTMRFGGLTAVSEFDFKVEPGKIFSIIGPNGAGKTTVFNAITGIYEPTEGAVEFEGREVSRPLTWKVWSGCGAVGLATAIAFVLAALNVDKLWRATVKRNYSDTLPFTYRAAWEDLWNYFDGDLAVEKGRGTRWDVVTADGKDSLAFAFLEDDARRLRDNYEKMIALDGSDRTLKERDGKWVLLGTDGTTLATFSTEEDARDKLRLCARIGRERGATKRMAWIALLLGLAIGTAGSYSVWRRARRTPDVISLGGIARTFQNIRLFQNMTVIENVMIGMDRAFRAGPLRQMVRSPGVRREERKALLRASELLTFVGLLPKANMLAMNLAYGEQRRLEIARALATGPRLLLLDEPAAGMNPVETVELMALIKKIQETGVTVLLIEHHMIVVMGISDRIAVLDYGVKIAEGTPEEVRANPKVIEAYLGKEEVT